MADRSRAVPCAGDGEKHSASGSETSAWRKACDHSRAASGPGSPDERSIRTAGIGSSGPDASSRCGKPRLTCCGSRAEKYPLRGRDFTYPSATSCAYAPSTVTTLTPRCSASARLDGRRSSAPMAPLTMSSRIRW